MVNTNSPHRLNFASPGVRCDGAEMINQTRELDPVNTGVRRARQPSFPLLFSLHEFGADNVPSSLFVFCLIVP